MRSNKRKICLIFVLTIILCLSSLVILPNSSLAQEKPDINEIKAAFVYNFLKFVNWKKSASIDEQFALNVCHAGDSKTIEKILLLNGRQANGRPIKVKETECNLVEKGCSVIFISEMSEEKQERLLKLAIKNNTLTVGDARDFAKRGGIIGLKIVDGKVRFDINLKTATLSNIEISSQLLKLADKVYR